MRQLGVTTLSAFVEKYLDSFGSYEVRPIPGRMLEVIRHDGRCVAVALPAESQRLSDREYFEATVEAVDQALARVAELEAKPWD